MSSASGTTGIAPAFTGASFDSGQVHQNVGPFGIGNTLIKTEMDRLRSGLPQVGQENNFSNRFLSASFPARLAAAMLS